MARRSSIRTPSGTKAVAVADGLRLPLAALRRRAEPRSVVGDVVLDDLRVGEVLVVDGQVSLNLEAEARGSEVVVAGTVRANWVGTCRRCLEEVGGEVDLTIREVMADGSVGDGDAYALGVDEADVEPVIRDAVLLALPLSPLCGEECDGPDPERFPTGLFGDGGSSVAEERDPRWAVLDVLRESDFPADGS